MFHPQLIGEPVPEKGRLRASALDKPGFGVELNRDIHAPSPTRTERARYHEALPLRPARGRKSPA
jgi:hypothetical protein